jgi:hypothetical protein
MSAILSVFCPVFGSVPLVSPRGAACTRSIPRPAIRTPGAAGALDGRIETGAAISKRLTVALCAGE